MATGQRPHGLEVDHLAGTHRCAVIEHAIERIDTVAKCATGRDRDQPDRRIDAHIADNGGGVVVVGADHGGLLRALCHEDAAFGLDIALHAAVTIEVIRRDIHQHGDIRRETQGQVELIGRGLDDIDGAGMHVRQVENADADIAADMDILTGTFQDMADQGRGRRLAIGAGDCHGARALVCR